MLKNLLVNLLKRKQPPKQIVETVELVEELVDIDVGRTNMSVVLKSGEVYKHTISGFAYFSEQSGMQIVNAKNEYYGFLYKFTTFPPNSFVSLVNIGSGQEVAVRSQDIDKIVNVEHTKFIQQVKTKLPKK